VVGPLPGSAPEPGGAVSMRSPRCRRWLAPAWCWAMMPGMPERRTHDHVRHGAGDLFAAFNIADGTVISSIHRRHRATELRKFLAKIDAEIPDDWVYTRSVTTTAPTRRRRPTPGWPGTHASTGISHRPDPAGSTRSNAGLASSPTSSSAAAATLPSELSRLISAPGPRDGTTTRKRSSGPRAPNRSSNR
jgi:hypothetical protein